MDWGLENQAYWGGPAAEATAREPRTDCAVDCEALEIPADLGEWVCPATVLSWVVQEAEMHRGIEKVERPASRNGQDASFRQMLVVLAFAYARKIYDADGIRDACRKDATLEKFCRGEVAFPSELRRFRRRNRSCVEMVLAGVLMRAIRHRFGLGAALLPEELKEDLRKLAAERLDIARHMDAGEC